jgi:hypothetical protein
LPKDKSASTDKAVPVTDKDKAAPAKDKGTPAKDKEKTKAKDKGVALPLNSPHVAVATAPTLDVVVVGRRPDTLSSPIV